MKRVCLIGPESTGKSKLSHDLAVHYRTVYVPEFARTWLNPKQGICQSDDIPIIAHGQIASEDALARRANRVLFCDTDVLLTTIWSTVLFGGCPDSIRKIAEDRKYDLYLLLDVDVPWVDDSQRFLPHRRAEFFDLCRSSLEAATRPFQTLRGNWAERFAQACKHVDKLLATGSANASAARSTALPGRHRIE